MPKNKKKLEKRECNPSLLQDLIYNIIIMMPTLRAPTKMMLQLNFKKSWDEKCAGVREEMQEG